MTTSQLYAVLLADFRRYGARGTGRLLGDVRPGNAYAMRVSRALASLNAFHRSHFGFILQLAAAYGYQVEFSLSAFSSHRPR